MTRRTLGDVTVRSPVHGNGTAFPAAAKVNGVVLSRAELQTVTKYREAVQSDLVELLTLGCKTGGRWNSTALELVDKLAAYRSKDVPAVLRRSVQE